MREINTIVTAEDIIAYTALGIGLLILAGWSIKAWLAEKKRKKDDNKRNTKGNR